MIEVGQKRKMRGGWTYIVTAIDGKDVKLVSDHGTEYEWSDHFVESDEIVLPADPENPQVGDRFRMFDRPAREYEILEVGADTVKVRYVTVQTWNKAYCSKDIPL